MLLLTAVFGIVLATIGNNVQRGKLQREAAASIRDMDGWAFYDYQFEDGDIDARFDLNAECPRSKWLQDTLGEDFFHTIIWVDFPDYVPSHRYGVPATDTRLACLRDLCDVRYLQLCGDGITDASIDHFAHFKKLESLDVRGTSISSNGLKRLRRIFPDAKILSGPLPWRY